MPKELIFTSVPNGLKPGSSGYCTVARHQNLDHLLERELERLSFYEMGTGLKPVIHAYRTLSLASGVFLVLSRICYAGNDHTGRTNYLAHHLVFEESELSSMPNLSPVDFFMDPIGWLNEWPKGKQPVIYNDGEGEKSPFCDPSKLSTNEHWQSVTGNQRNVYEPIYRTNWGFICEDGSHELSLSLIQELCSLPEVNYQLAWLKFSFTTFLQKSDNPSDFYFVCGPASGAIGGLNLNFLYLGNSSGNCFKASGSNSLGSLVPQHKETTFEQAIANDELSTPSNRGIQEEVQIAPVQPQNLNVVDYQSPTYGQPVVPEFASNADAPQSPYQDKSSKKLIISAIVVVLLFLLGGAFFLVIKFNQVEEFEYTQVEEPVDEGIQTTQKPDTPYSVSIEKSEEIAPVKTIPSKESNEIEKPKTEIETPVFSAPDYPEKWTLEQKKEFKDSLTEIVLVSSFKPEEIKNSEVYAWSKNNQKFEWQDTISEFVDLDTILASRTEIMKKGGFETEKMVVKIKQTGPQVIVMTGSFPAGLLFDRKLDLTSATYKKFHESVKSVLRVCNPPPLNVRTLLSTIEEFNSLISKLDNRDEHLDKIEKEYFNTKEIYENIKKINDNIIDPIEVNPVLIFLEREYTRLENQSKDYKQRKNEIDADNRKISAVRGKIIEIFDFWPIDSRDWRDGQNEFLSKLGNTMKEYFKEKGFSENQIKIAGVFPKKLVDPKAKSKEKSEKNIIKFSKKVDEVELSLAKKLDLKNLFIAKEKKRDGKDFNLQKTEKRWEMKGKEEIRNYIEKEYSLQENKLDKLNDIKDVEFAFETIVTQQENYNYLKNLKEIVTKLKLLCDTADQYHGAKETWKVHLNGSNNIEIILDQ